MFQLSSKSLINLTKMKTRYYYQLLVNKEAIELKGNSIGEKDLPMHQTSLKPFFSRVRSVCKG